MPEPDTRSAGQDQRQILPRPTSARELKDVIAAERRGVPFLLYRDADGTQVLHPLEDGAAVTIGRGEQVDVRLSWDSSVSSVHAEVIRLGAHWLISDEGISRNGTFVNSERLAGRRRLRHGDIVRVGHTSIAYSEAATTQPDGGTTALDDEDLAPAITEAQRRVLSALCRPFAERTRFATPATNQEIADELYISIEAVKTQLRMLYRRFGLEDLPQKQKRPRLAERAIQLGLAGPASS
jgi:pSer/pThr/pTyr-binding forkhead associated (FHA) protein